MPGSKQACTLLMLLTACAGAPSGEQHLRFHQCDAAGSTTLGCPDSEGDPGETSTSGAASSTTEASGTSVASDSDSETDWFDLPPPQINPCSPHCPAPADPPEDLSTVPGCQFEILESSSTGDVLRCAQNLACALGRDPTLAEFLAASTLHTRSASRVCTGSSQSGQPAIYEGETLVDPRCIVGSFVENGLWCSFNVNNGTAIECVTADVNKVCGRNPISIELESVCEHLAPFEQAYTTAKNNGVGACGACHQPFDPKTRRVDIFGDKDSCFNFPIDGFLLKPGPPGEGAGLLACPDVTADPTDESELLIFAGKTIDPKLGCDNDLKPLENNAEYLELHPEQIEVLRMLCPNTVIGGAKLQQNLDPLPVPPQLQPQPPPPP